NTTITTGHVYFVETGGGAAGILSSPAPIVGGLTWQPQLVKVVADDTKYSTLVRTNELFPHQTCCILIANESFTSANPEVTERVVWAIVKATDWINQAKAAGAKDPKDPSYVQLLNIARSVSGAIYNTSDNEGDLRDVGLALADIEYDWGNVTSTGAPDYNSATPLGKLKADVALQTDDLIKIGTIKNQVADLGFKNSAEFADAFVNDTYLKNVLKNGITKVPSYKDKADARFILISGDLHQLPVHVADAILTGETSSYYSQVGINFEKVWVGLGNAVLAGLIANEADFGVSGQPTIIADNVNNKRTVKE
ncbi:MAG: hypothetical protein LBM39_01745, partial [Candidatus Methanoplasma sp.]|nr:hypothetical protein [Candidatus Methanoplasma sp.]